MIKLSLGYDFKLRNAPTRISITMNDPIALKFIHLIVVDTYI